MFSWYCRIGFRAKINLRAGSLLDAPARVDGQTGATLLSAECLSFLPKARVVSGKISHPHQVPNQQKLFLKTAICW